MTWQDLDFCVALARTEGWESETPDMFEALLTGNPAGCLIACDGAERAGMCMVTGYQQSAHIGEFIVKKDRRGQGIGRLLMETALTHLEQQGFGTVYLDAVPDAVPLYEKFGFRKTDRSLRFQGCPEKQDAPDVHRMHKRHLDDIIRLDKQYFGQDRSWFLKWKAFIAPDFAQVISSANRVRGFVLGRYAPDGISVGPWIADAGVSDPGALLKALSPPAAGACLNLGVLEQNTRSIQILKELGFREKTASPPWRMVKGRDMHTGEAPECLAIGSPAKG